MRRALASSLSCLALVGAALASPAWGASSAQTVAAAKAPLTSFFQDLYAGKTQACSFADARAQAEFRGTGEDFWEALFLKKASHSELQGLTTAKIQAKAQAAVPSCQAAVSVAYQIISSPGGQASPLSSTLASVKAAHGQVEGGGHAVRLTGQGALSGEPVLVVLHGSHWLIDDGLEPSSGQ
jgi:hypothetical protein